MQSELLSKDEIKAIEKAQKKADKQAAKLAKEKAANSDDKQEAEPRLFVINFNGSMDAHEAETLREEVTAVLAVATSNDEVLIKLESPGGVVHGYGLASSQLARIRERTISLTAAVDKVAASG